MCDTRIATISLILQHLSVFLFIVLFQWNEVIEAFRQGVPRGKHRRYMRSADNCFLGSTAVDWLLEHLKKRKDFSSEVTR